MIAKLTGKIDSLHNNYAIVDVNGVGYQVNVTDFTFGKLAGKNEVELFTYTYVREDILALYGFLEMAEKEMFELLISISGIGPKAAMGILSIAEPKTIRAAILNEDYSVLTRVSGVGKKTAERVVLELKNKVADMSEGEKDEAFADSETLEALQAMGYSLTEAREALKNIPPEINDIGERIKIALKELGK